MKDQIDNSEKQGEEMMEAKQEAHSLGQTTKWVITFDEKPISSELDGIEKALKDEKNCLKRRFIGTDEMVELWELEGSEIEIKTNIQTILSGVHSTNTHNGLNIGIGFKEENAINLDISKYKLPDFGEIRPDQEEILIAVLDTGVSTALIPEEYLWKNSKDGKYGKSFINNGGKVEDDDRNLHGTLVSSFIINQFKDSGYRVKIMNLKTHDGNGKGDLYAIVDAIYFAKKNHAKIVNASWGFYNSQLFEDSYLKELIFNKLYEEGVLFVTVSGNKQANDGAQESYFYPGEFGRGVLEEKKNMIVVTTVSPNSPSFSKTQNFSPDWVDLGVPCDYVTRIGNKFHYVFELPFKRKDEFVDGESPVFVSGSSFAAAIASGLMGSFLSENYFPEIYKKGENETANMKEQVGAKGSADEKNPDVKRKPINKKKLIDIIGSDLFGQRGALSSGIKDGRILKRKIISS